ncbi:hypothetical protein ACH5RR_003621 [Cinchona calisaya]|uniref:Uncharacterized protein n=1 Tax=Cinchona calisaya TaxID=153742 RepID=A0ABD3AVJ9_9GENT
MNCSDNHDAIINSSEVMECEPRRVDQEDQLGEDTERNLPKEFLERVTISEPSSSTITKKRKGIKLKASKSFSTLVTKKASKSKRKEIRVDDDLSSRPVHHITRDGFVEICESIGETCFLSVVF